MSHQIGGTFIVGVTTTPDPVRTAVLARLDAAPAATLARIHARYVGFHGSRAELARRLELTDSGLRTHLDAMEADGYAVREKFNFAGRWGYVIAVTDTPGILPDRAALRDAFVNGVSTWSQEGPQPAIPPQHGVTQTDATSSFPRPAATCDDSSSPQVAAGRGMSHVNRFPLTPPPATGGERRAGEPVNRFNPAVPQSGEGQAYNARRAAANRSVISSLGELETLAKMRGARPTDGGKFRTSREILAVSRPLDQTVVEEGLALLGAVQLPFWVAPEVWALLERGWSPDRVSAELDGVHSAKSAHSAARYRLARALEGANTESARTDSAETDPSVTQEPAAAPFEPDTCPDLDGIVSRDSSPAETWEEQAAAWAVETGAGDDSADLPGLAPWDQTRRFGRRAPVTPQVPTWNDRAQEFETIREESGGGVAFEAHRESKVAEIRAGMLALKKERGGW